MHRMRIFIILAVVVGTFMTLAPSANAASLGRLINEGLSDKASTATSRVKQLVEVNPKVASAISSDMGVSASSVDWNTAKAAKKGKCLGYNTGESSNGSVVTTQYGWYACWKFKVKVGTKTMSFNMKRDCSNPLLKKKLRRHMPRAKVIKKTKTLKIKEPFKLRVKHVCPNGQTVTVTVSGVVRGTVKSRVWGKIWGGYSLKVKTQTKLAIDGKIAVECGAASVVPSPSMVQQIECGTGWYWSNVYLNCIQVVCGVVIVGDSNNVNIGDICTTALPPPTCPDGRPVPSNGDCDRPPTGEIIASAAHMQTGGRHVKLYFIGDDADGDSVTLDILLVAPTGTYVSGKTPVTQFSDPNLTCPSDKTCWEATLRSGDTPGEAKVSGKFIGSDPNKPFITEPVIIMIVEDQFPAS